MNRVLVVGGGIGGLTVAIALRQLGLEVELIEKADTFSQVGAGITIQANAQAIFQTLGIDLPAEDTISIGKVEMLNGAGQVLMAGDTSGLAVDTPSVNIHRADLHRNLLRVAEGIPLRAGIALTTLTVDENGVDVTLSDGSKERWDVVIGADGIHSTTRRLLLGEKGTKTRYSGQTCWRFACDAPGGRVPSITRELWRPGQRIGAVPLSRQRLYIYMVNSAPQGTQRPGSNHPDVLRELFGQWHEEVDAVLAELDESVPIHHGDLSEHASISFGRGRVVLLGDAAHAMTPNMGQGAGMAIEDAAALALLWSQQAPEKLAEALASKRMKRVEQVKKMSWRVGWMAHWQWKPLCWLRDRLLRSMPAEGMNKQALAMWTPGIQLSQALQKQLPA